MPQIGCSILHRLANFQDTSTTSKFAQHFDEIFAVDFLQKGICAKLASFYLEKNILYGSRILLSHFFFKNVPQYLLINPPNEPQ